MSHALVVDDDVDSASTLAALIAAEGFTVASAHTLRDARRQIVLQQPDIVLLDLQLPDGSGMELFTDSSLIANSEVVLITGHASIETSIQALRLGAADYLIKPVNLRQLQGVLSRFMKPSALKAEVAGLSDSVAKTGRFGHLWGRAPSMLRVYEQISRVAGTGVTVFITGESGAGKEVVAQTVHDLSRRRKQPFLAVNCGAVSPTLIESEIFGHEKGSFTGAERQHQGYFERAAGGTLFLDEITEMPASLQVKLLRVLETGRFMRVGSTQSLEADVRVIAATNRDPMQAVAQGKLREDLLYRLNVFPIELPPLRERLEDLPLLAEHFLSGIAEQEGKVKRFTPAALAQLAAYSWPGNVRELRNAVQRAYVMAEGDSIDAKWLPQQAAADNGMQTAAGNGGHGAANGGAHAAQNGGTNGGTHAGAHGAANGSGHAQPAAATNSNHPHAPAPPPAQPVATGAANTRYSAGAAAQAPEADPNMVSFPIGTSVAEAERQLILATLRHYHHHKERTAAVLGISLKTLYNRLKEYAAAAANEPAQLVASNDDV